MPNKKKTEKKKLVTLKKIEFSVGDQIIKLTEPEARELKDLLMEMFPFVISTYFSDTSTSWVGNSDEIITYT